MPSYKDKNNKWYCQFYYQDHTGKRKKKFKRGFTFKRDAEAWERDFLERVQGSPEMTLQSLTELYLNDIKLNCKPVTYRTRESRCRMWIVPYFGSRPINQIKAVNVKEWQNYLKKQTGRTGSRLSSGYIGTLHRELSALMNYAVKYYDLPKNPCKDAGNISGSRKRSMQFWTLEQYKKFIDTFDTADPFRIAFDALYFCGMRLGELQALTISDIDFKAHTIKISKTFHIIAGEHITTTTKTAKGNRTIAINKTLESELRQHINRLYKPDPGTRIFSMTSSAYGKRLKKHAAAAGIPSIRVHDLRHSHASLLINMGISPLVISERLGHEKVSTTLDIYSHLYPAKQDELITLLESVSEKIESK